VSELPALARLALEIGADALHLFMLVPVGCGTEIAPSEMLPATDERVRGSTRSRRAAHRSEGNCAPHYYRIRAQRPTATPQQR
jgi:MoaA/NifB/PqqE/SkfB family radical SAM enzyme